MKRGVLFLLCGRERERASERESSWVSVSPVWDMQRQNEGERGNSREAGIITHCLCIREKRIRELNAGVTER